MQSIAVTENRRNGAVTSRRRPTAAQSVAFLTTGFTRFDNERAEFDSLDLAGYRRRPSVGGGTTDESLIVGVASIDGRQAVLAVGAFDYMGGSMGATHGSRFERAVDLAIDRRLPLVVATASGGARMQEGTIALSQMARTTRAVARLRSQHVPFVVFLRSPTTGGVYSSYAALADVSLAEEGALIAFAGPRVEAALSGDEGPVRTAELAMAHGLVDEVVSLGEAQAAIARWLDLLTGTQSMGRPVTQAADLDPASLDPKDALDRARSPNRPAIDRYLAMFGDWSELRGDRCGADDVAVLTGFARINGKACAVIATDVRSGSGHLSATGFRKAVRIVALAHRLGLPLVTLIDTRGADPSLESENAGIANAMGQLFLAIAEMRESGVRTIAVVLGEAASGGAMALACCDRVLMQEDAVFPVIAPNAAAAILGREEDESGVSQLLRYTATDMRDLGIVDRILPGPTLRGDEEAISAVRAALIDELWADQGKE